MGAEPLSVVNGFKQQLFRLSFHGHSDGLRLGVFHDIHGQFPYGTKEQGLGIFIQHPGYTLVNHVRFDPILCRDLGVQPLLQGG